jgi:hypothetical protein
VRGVSVPIRFFLVISAIALAVGDLRSPEAGAVTRFQCGLNRVSGKLFVSGIRGRGQPADEPGVVRAPILVLWAGTMSETEIPLKVSDFQREELKGLATDPLFAEFDLEIREAGTRPSYANLVAYRLPDSKKLKEGGPREVELLKPLACGSAPQAKAAPRRKQGG